MFRRSSLHWFLTAGFLLSLFPLFYLARLPLRIDFAQVAGAYWLGAGVRAVSGAVLLYLIAFPWRDTVGPALARFRANKSLLVLGLVFLVSMVWLFGFFLGLEVVVFGLAGAELMIHRQQSFGEALADVAIPALYLFVGVVVVFSFQHGIAGWKFAGSYDGLFQRLDRIIFHADVSAISHFALAHLPLWAQQALEFGYYGLFTQLGATMIILALASGRRAAMQYVATLLTAYYIGLTIFALWPTMGPFSICATHVSGYPNSLATFISQETILTKARLILAHNPSPDVQAVNMADYYIGFPCLHVALPLIAIWFLRKWRKLVLVLILFDVLLVAGIILLEQHYLVDIVAGVGVAILAVSINPTRAGSVAVTYAAVETEAEHPAQSVPEMEPIPVKVP